MLKKTKLLMLLIVSLILNSAAYANIVIPLPTTVDHNLTVTIPTFRPGFSFNLAVLALQPGASNLNYAIFKNESTIQSPTWIEQEIWPSYRAGFGLGTTYTFCDGKDIRLNWTHFNHGYSDSIAAANTNYSIGPDYQIGEDAALIRNASSSAGFRYDVVNLDIGQYVDFGSLVEARFFIGLSNVYLREQVNTTYSGNTTTGSFQGPFGVRQQVTANFTGFGPRLGILGSLYLGKGFNFFGEGAISALVGDTHSKTTFKSNSQALSVIYNQGLNNQYIKDQDVTRVIPAIDTQLGIGFKYPLCYGGVLTLKGGYQAAVYSNAISQYLPGSLEGSMNSGSIFVATLDHTLSDYSVHGFFVEANISL